ISLILLSFAIIVTFSVRSYYYNSVRQKLQSMGQSGAIAEYFNGYIDVSNETFSTRAIEYAHNFSDINTAWVWVYNKDGEIVVTTTGFEPDAANDDDYKSALSSPSGIGMSEGRLDSGEKFMALTVMLPKTGGDSNGAVRYLISLQDINKKVIQVGLVLLVIVFVAIAFVVISGLFFIRSILVPVKKINTVTRKIADGNYSEKVEVSNRYDEISELSESINYMTDQISRTDRLKNEFISTVSHELRTPLTAIKGWTETLITINESEDETLSQGLKVILYESERLYSLVEDLLDFSRMENGNMPLRMKKIDILAELDDAVFVLRDRAMREGIDIFYSTPDFPAPTTGDPDKIKQVFVNILDNAIKYTPAGGNISIIAALDVKNLKITVSDTGCGISEEDLPHVKEKFYKANVSVKGSGIGLAVCDEIIRSHKGSLNIKSKLGEGTNVEMIFPLYLLNGEGKNEK
ncbi:MAG: HAMP domain-containing histidine kinase, partial [Oscillospiraceae bacterium]|nr:HAMP domain-containing histidine kinase [Oscillospiraceae bacterium]